ncbi:hypothetical protein FHS26_003766 [Rhizobium pisi]|uniref:Uncharacterized protein n=1 Tax=Rhizobium pisi TaxID=574561 RepID=A0A7W5BN54_9HYPH|nr:hypothetical protein [Rhizobium pisi]MBB3136019.1 hypothetical protein [Rhizobium pisi]
MRPQLAQAPNTDLEWEVEAVLAWHDEDPRAAITTLLLDCQHLRRQLALTTGASSVGFTRGWTPTYERPER